jgi:ankyrin repeat protein
MPPCRSLRDAARKGDFIAICNLLESGADPNTPDSKGYTPLSWACRYGHLRIAKVLASHGASPSIADKYGELPLHRALRNGHLDVVQWLQEHVANNMCFIENTVGLFDVDAIYMAAKNGQTDACHLILKYLPNINATKKNGTTPLGEAIREGDIATAMLLLTLGADPNQRIWNNSDCIPLEFAANKCNTDMMSLLISYGASLNDVVIKGHNLLAYTQIKRIRRRFALFHSRDRNPYDLKEAQQREELLHNTDSVIDFLIRAGLKPLTDRELVLAEEQIANPGISIPISPKLSNLLLASLTQNHTHEQSEAQINARRNRLERDGGQMISHVMGFDLPPRI